MGVTFDSPRQPVLTVSGGEEGPVEGYPFPNGAVDGYPVPFSRSQAEVEWRTGLFDVLSDPDICLYGTFCTPCLFGANVRSLQELDGERNASCLPSCAALVCATGLTSALTVAGASAASYAALGGAAAAPATLGAASRLAHNLGDIMGSCVGGAITSASRTRLRNKFGIAENETFSDFVQHLLCQPCAVCQEAREIRGFYADAVAREMMGDVVTGAPEPQSMSAREGGAVEYSPDTKPSTV